MRAGSRGGGRVADGAGAGAGAGARRSGSGLASQRVGRGASPAIDGVWLDVLNGLCSRAAHELKGALNGVSVNLEVVRSRSAKPDAAANAVTKYADAAGDQLGAVITMADALLALTRTEREPVDVGLVVRRVEALLGPAARAEGHQLEIDPMVADLGSTSAGGTAARLALAAALLAAVESSAHVACGPDSGGAPKEDGRAGPGIRIECRDDARVPAIDPRVLHAVADAGIRIQTEPTAILISFPR